MGSVPLRILIIGAGAIGSLLGVRLGLSGHDVTLVGRQRFVETARAEGLTMILPDGTRQVAHVAAVDSIAPAFAAQAVYDLMLLTVKSYDTAAAVTALLAVAHAGHEHGAGYRLPPVLTLQNGVGNEEVLANAFGAGQVIAGAIDTPVSVPTPGVVQIHRDASRIGLAAVGLDAPVMPAAAALESAGFHTTRFSDYRGLKWTKLLMNILANASCAILDWTPAQVMADPAAARLEARSWQEALAVMAGLRISPVPLGGYPFPWILPIVRHVSPGWLARGLRSLVSGGRGTKLPSLQIALSSGKPTEVAWLNGAVASHARRLGRPTPVNDTFANLLLSISTGQTPWSEYRGCPDRLEELINHPA